MIAITRPVPASIAQCELTHVERVPIDLDRAREQHAQYESLLASLGARIVHAPPADDLPDSVFVEDTAVVLEAIAIVTIPGAASRRLETPAIAEALAPFRRVVHLTPPATLDGGDVLRLGRRLYVGVGGRTNQEGAVQLAMHTAPLGYDVRTVRTRGCLHLKTAATEAAPEAVIVNPAWVDPAAFEGCRTIEVDPGEPFAANVLRIGDTIVTSAAFPRTAARLRPFAPRLASLDVSELAKAEGALTCCSLILAD